MFKKAKQLALRGKICLLAALVLYAGAMTVLICGGSLPFGVMYPIAVTSIGGSITLLVLYIVKYRCIGRCVKLLKTLRREDCGEDIDLSKPALGKRVYCGRAAMFTKTPYALIPYDEIGWMQSRKGSEGGICCRLKSGGKIPVLIDPISVSQLTNKYIRVHNPDLLIGNTPQVERAYLERYAQAKHRKNRGLLIGGVVTAAVGGSALTVGLIKKTIDGAGIGVLSAIFLAGVIMALSAKVPIRFKEWVSGMCERARTSLVINPICKIGSVLAGVALIGIFVCASAKWEVLLPYCLIGYAVAMVPFTASIFLQCGFFLSNRKPLDEKKLKKYQPHINEYHAFVANVYLCASHAAPNHRTTYVCIHKETKALFSFTGKAIVPSRSLTQCRFVKPPREIKTYSQLLHGLRAKLHSFYSDLSEANWESYFHFMLLPPDHSGETLKKQLLSCDKGVVRNAVFAVHNVVLKPPALRKAFLEDAYRHLALIKKNLDAVDLSGMFVSGNRFAHRAVKIIEGNHTDRCFCRLLIDEFGPGADGLAKEGFILVQPEKAISDYSRQGVIACPICHKHYSIIEEYTGWHIPTRISCIDLTNMTWEQSVRALNNDGISLQNFIRINASRPLYYSTPTGENQEGKEVVWLRNHPEQNKSLYPVFTTRELCHQSFANAGRKNFIIIEGTLESALASLDSHPALKSLGLLVEDENGCFPIPSLLAEDAVSPEEYLDDVTFIREMKRVPCGAWQQYDVLLAARGYGWDMMKDWADYMSDADLEHISQVTVASPGAQEKDVTQPYADHGGKCKNTPALDVEMGMLSVAGMSKTLRAPMKIVWINQTKVLRFFTMTEDEVLMKKYVETMVRRSFGTKDAMKLAKPIPEGE